MPALNLPASFYMTMQTRHCLFVCILLMLIPLHIFSQKVTGYVSDSNGKPLVQAHVALKGEKSGAYTGRDGNYELRQIKNGAQVIVASYVGYVSVQKPLTIENQGVYRLDFVLIPDTMQIPAVVVRAVTQSEVTGLPVRITTLEAKDISVRPESSTPDLLASVSGIHVYNESGIFSSSVVNIRGIGGSSQTGTLVMVDGIPVNKSDGGSVNWNLIDKDRISRIEIVKGPGSALFGSNAMGGVINIITDEIDGSGQCDLSAAYGTYNTLDIKGRWQGSGLKNRVYFKVFSNYRKSDGYISTPDEVIKENDTIVVPVFLDDFFAGAMAGIRMRNGGSAEMSVSFFKDIRGRGTRIYEEAGSFTARNTLQGYARYRASFAGWDIKLSLFGLREDYSRLNEYLSDGEYKLYEVDSQRDDAGFRGLADRKLTRDRTLTLGAELRAGRVEAKDLYYTSTDMITNRGSLELASLFIQYLHPFRDQRWKGLLGLRYDHSFFHDASFSIDQPSYSIEYFTEFAFQSVQPVSWGAFSPKGTLRFTPGEKSSYYVTVARGFRAPVLDDLCRAERIQTGLRAANPQLKPEYIWHFEGGTDLKIRPNLLLAVSAYNTLGLDFMHPLSTGDSVNLGYTLAPIFMMSNITRAGITGFEADVSFEPVKQLFLFGNYTLTMAKILEFHSETEADTDLTGKFLSNLPMHRCSFGGRLTTRWLSFSSTVRYTGHRWIRDDNATDQIYLLTDRYTPYTTADLGIRKQFSAFSAGLDVENVFNIVYINSKGYKSPGRMIFLKLQYVWKY